MTDHHTQVASPIRLAAESEKNWQSDLIAEFQLAPKEPAPGLPGKNPGDLLIVPGKGGSKVIVSLGEGEKLSLEIVR